ncbi:hypothetical protein [Myxococcus virescens]|uniref:hypothetical protein n=1 Tax=Myxococcus virescens TaxID=83456 RepID=UPI00115FD698|nr:hypothetical protein [Myxococcus virescens]
MSDTPTKRSRTTRGTIVRQLPARLTARADSAVQFLAAKLGEEPRHPALEALLDGEEYAASASGALNLGVEVVAKALGWTPPTENDT